MKTLKFIGLSIFLFGLGIFVISLTFGEYELTDKVIKESITKDVHRQALTPKLKDMMGKTYSSTFGFAGDFQKIIDELNDSYKAKGEWNKVIWDDYTFKVTKHANKGFLKGNSGLFFFLSFILGSIGALLYIIPKVQLEGSPGIKNNGIFHRAISSQGWIGIILGCFLIAFYVLLYWFPQHIVSWVILVDPISQFMNGNEASQWFLYGLLYTLAIIIMGIRMLIKYRHSPYQKVRTTSVIFFQTAFAFLIPQILATLNLPEVDLKNMWPLDYDFFDAWNLDMLQNTGGIGIFMLVWGISLFVLGVPILVYFFGKRWYCSWVCGCGGLAETLGDPFRQLSDKSVKAWKIERVLIHSVLVFAIIMTAGVLYTYFAKQNDIFGIQTYPIRKTYGFLIGSVFSGVIGTGFYPLMGSRVWCRFGCPLAAYLGIVQRFKSKFRITTNGGQCISCGNCSTYCEMGIDVRSYAQKGQNIVRSSCVGCGVCSAVCPRGVLNLENLDNTDSSRTEVPAVILGRNV